MFLLIFYLVLALGISFLCSIMESVLLSITPSFAAAFEEKSPRRGAALRRLKSDIDRPLAAILSLNTIAHTIGAAGVGAQSLMVFGNGYVAVTSVVLTFLILVLSEIIPKTLGALYWRQLASVTTRILGILILILYPLVVFSRKLTQLLSRGKKSLSISRDEFRAMADIGFEEGLFLEKESHIIKNLMRFKSLKAKDVMTPRPVMLALSENMNVGEVLKAYPELQFSRIPVFQEESDNVRAYVLKNDILLSIAREEMDKKLRDLAREILVVPETVPLLHLFEQLMDRLEHIALVVDEYGGVAGLVTMEDVVETLLGIEIVDETDETIDMQVLARQQWYKRARALGIVPEENSPEKNSGRRKESDEN